MEYRFTLSAIHRKEIYYVVLFNGVAFELCSFNRMTFTFTVQNFISNFIPFRIEYYPMRDGPMYVSLPICSTLRRKLVKKKEIDNYKKKKKKERKNKFKRVLFRNRLTSLY